MHPVEEWEGTEASLEHFEFLTYLWLCTFDLYLPVAVSGIYPTLTVFWIQWQALCTNFLPGIFIHTKLAKTLTPIQFPEFELQVYTTIPTQGRQSYHHFVNEEIMKAQGQPRPNSKPLYQ